MPIYEYECDGCHEVFEVRQKISDPPPGGHACGSQSVHRVLSPTTFVLKGTGWYKTDYAEKPVPKPKAEGDGKGEGKAPAKGDSSDGAAAPKAAAGDAGAAAKASPAPAKGGQGSAGRPQTAGR